MRTAFAIVCLALFLAACGGDTPPASEGPEAGTNAGNPAPPPTSQPVPGGAAPPNAAGPDAGGAPSVVGSGG